MPHSEETVKLVDIGDGTMKSYEDLWMDGSRVFNFVQKEVPPLIEEALEYSTKKSEDEIEWYLFHQPNKFMLQKLADKMNIPWDKVPMNVVAENFGNLQWLSHTGEYNIQFKG
ncbi:MAG: 3-oxoacyl-[acyl-carrier-protein] synthase III C-terminal domain-containing protein [Clostridium sp.]